MNVQQNAKHGDGRRVLAVTARRGERGFTLAETAAALLILMVAGMAVASLFVYSIQNNARTKDRELAMAVAQKRMEWLRNIPYTVDTRAVAYHFPDDADTASGGLGATDEDGVAETVVSAGRTYNVVTVIANNGGASDANSTVKTIAVSVTPAVERPALGRVTLVTQRSIIGVGSN